MNMNISDDLEEIRNNEINISSTKPRQSNTKVLEAVKHLTDKVNNIETYMKKSEENSRLNSTHNSGTNSMKSPTRSRELAQSKSKFRNESKKKNGTPGNDPSDRLYYHEQCKKHTADTYYMV